MAGAANAVLSAPSLTGPLCQHDVSAKPLFLEAASHGLGLHLDMILSTKVLCLNKVMDSSQLSTCTYSLTVGAPLTPT